MTDAESKDLAYWERNALALRYAEGWYDDLLELGGRPVMGPRYEGWRRVLSLDGGKVTFHIPGPVMGPRYKGWRRVLSLDGGKVTFHIPDDFDVGTLPEIAPNWDGHTTEQKWRRLLAAAGVRGAGLSPDGKLRAKETWTMENEFLLQFFQYSHLPAHLQAVSKPFGELADKICETLPRNAERTVALRKLLEAKDCAVRALLAK